MEVRGQCSILSYHMGLGIELRSLGVEARALPIELKLLLLLLLLCVSNMYLWRSEDN